MPDALRRRRAAHRLDLPRRQPRVRGAHGPGGRDRQAGHGGDPGHPRDEPGALRDLRSRHPDGHPRALRDVSARPRAVVLDQRVSPPTRPFRRHLREHHGAQARGRGAARERAAVPRGRGPPHRGRRGAGCRRADRREQPCCPCHPRPPHSTSAAARHPSTRSGTRVGRRHARSAARNTRRRWHAHDGTAGDRRRHGRAPLVRRHPLAARECPAAP